MYELNINFVNENKYHFNRLNVYYVGVSASPAVRTRVFTAEGTFSPWSGH